MFSLDNFVFFLSESAINFLLAALAEICLIIHPSKICHPLGNVPNILTLHPNKICHPLWNFPNILTLHPNKIEVPLPKCPNILINILGGGPM